MSSLYQTSPSLLGGSQLEHLRTVWGFLAFMGAALIVLGVLAIGSAFTVAYATVLMFGVLLLVGGVFQVIAAFLGRNWSGFFLHLLAGILYLIVGLFMMEHTIEAILILTLLIAVSLLANGLARIFVSLIQQFDGWGWMLLNGLISLCLGIAIWKQWPLSGFWVIGLFVGIEMIFSGVSWLMLGLAARAALR